MIPARRQLSRSPRDGDDTAAGGIQNVSRSPRVDPRSRTHSRRRSWVEEDQEQSLPLKESAQPLRYPSAAGANRTYSASDFSHARPAASSASLPPLPRESKAIPGSSHGGLLPPIQGASHANSDDIPNHDRLLPRGGGGGQASSPLRPLPRRDPLSHDPIGSHHILPGSHGSPDVHAQGVRNAPATRHASLPGGRGQAVGNSYNNGFNHGNRNSFGDGGGGGSPRITLTTPDGRVQAPSVSPDPAMPVLPSAYSSKKGKRAAEERKKILADVSSPQQQQTAAAGVAHAQQGRQLTQQHHSVRGLDDTADSGLDMPEKPLPPEELKRVRNVVMGLVAAVVFLDVAILCLSAGQIQLLHSWNVFGIFFAVFSIVFCSSQALAAFKRNKTGLGVTLLGLLCTALADALLLATIDSRANECGREAEEERAAGLVPTTSAQCEGVVGAGASNARGVVGGNLAAHVLAIVASFVLRKMLFRLMKATRPAPEARARVVGAASVGGTEMHYLPDGDIDAEEDPEYVAGVGDSYIHSVHNGAGGHRGGRAAGHGGSRGYGNDSVATGHTRQGRDVSSYYTADQGAAAQAPSDVSRPRAQKQLYAGRPNHPYGPGPSSSPSNAYSSSAAAARGGPSGSMGGAMGGGPSGVAGSSSSSSSSALYSPSQGRNYSNPYISTRADQRQHLPQLRHEVGEDNQPASIYERRLSGSKRQLEPLNNPREQRLNLEAGAQSRGASPHPSESSLPAAPAYRNPSKATL